jgi:hypothetical protein
MTAAIEPEVSSHGGSCDPEIGVVDPSHLDSVLQLSKDGLNVQQKVFRRQ